MLQSLWWDIPSVNKIILKKSISDLLNLKLEKKILILDPELVISLINQYSQSWQNFSEQGQHQL